MSTEMVFVEFLERVGAWDAGHIEPLKRSVAEGFISAGQAKASDAVQHLRASLQADSEKKFAQLEERMLSALKPAAPAAAPAAEAKPLPPGSGSAVDFNVVGAGVPPEDRQPLRFTDALRCIAVVSCPSAGFDPQLVNYCRRRLSKYSGERKTYTLNEETGEQVVHVERVLPNGGFESVQRTGTDSVSGGASYGFTLKPDFLGNLFMIAREQEVFASAARELPVNQGNELRWPALGQYAAPKMVNGVMQAAVFGGIQLAYKGEATKRDSSDAATEEITFKIEDLTGFTSFSRDYVVDNYIAMDSVVSNLFAEAMAWVEDWVCIRGDGIAKPEGFLNANARIYRARDTSAHIKYEDLVWMLSRLSSADARKARWLTNRTSIPELASITNHAGNYVYQPNALIAQSDLLSVLSKGVSDEAKLVERPEGILLGLPLFFSEKMSILGSTGDLALVIPSAYGIARRQSLEVGVSEHFYFDTDRIAYRFKLRHDGKSLWRAPYIQADNPTSPGSGTQVSPFIVLQ